MVHAVGKENQRVSHIHSIELPTLWETKRHWDRLLITNVWLLTFVSMAGLEVTGFAPPVHRYLLTAACGSGLSPPCAT